MRRALSICKRSALGALFAAVSLRHTSTIHQTNILFSNKPHDGALDPAAGSHAREEAHLPSTEVFNDNNSNAAADDEPFDELEAAAQEIHDICVGITDFLRKSVPDQNHETMDVRKAKKFDPNTSLISRREAKTPRYGTNYSYQTKQQLDEATALYFQLGDKLMKLLTKAVMDRMLDNIKEMRSGKRRDGVYHRSNVLSRHTVSKMKTRFYRHAPFEIQNLRADMPEVFVKGARMFRDQSTISRLQAFLQMHHPYREQLEKRMWEISSSYNRIYQ